MRKLKLAKIEEKELLQSLLDELKKSIEDEILGNIEDDLNDDYFLYDYDYESDDLI